MRRSRKASRNDALVATVSLRALKSRLPALASLDHHGMSPQRKVMRMRSGLPGSPPPFPPGPVPAAAGPGRPGPGRSGRRSSSGRAPRRRPRPGRPRSSGRSWRGVCRERSVRTCGLHCGPTGPGRIPAPDLGVRLPERAAHGLAKVRTYVRLLCRGPVVPPFPGAPRRPGRPGPARHARRRADPAGAAAAGPALPRRLPASGHDHDGGGPPRARRDHPGPGAPGRGVGRRQLVRRRGPARPRGGGGGRARARPAARRLRAPPGQRVGRGGR